MKKFLFILSMFCLVASFYSCTDASASLMSPKKESIKRDVSKKYAEISGLTVDSFMKPPFDLTSNGFKFTSDDEINNITNRPGILNTQLSNCRMIIPEKNFNELCENYIKFIKTADENDINYYSLFMDTWYNERNKIFADKDEAIIKSMSHIVRAIGPRDILNPISVDPILAVKVDAGYVILTQW